jgi:hypothetical protein
MRIAALLEDNGARAVPIYGCQPMSVNDRGQVVGYLKSDVIPSAIRRAARAATVRRRLDDAGGEGLRRGIIRPFGNGRGSLELNPCAANG